MPRPSRLLHTTALVTALTAAVLATALPASAAAAPRTVLTEAVPAPTAVR